MLEKLDDVPWSTLHHAYGPAADVPAQLRALASGDAAAREESLRILFRTIFHQGTRYEASAPAVPFLLELLAAPGTLSKEELIELLVALAIGYDESHLPGGFPLAELRAAAVGGAELLRDGGGSWDRLKSLDESDQNRLQAYLELSAYEAVAAAVPLFVSLMTSEDPAVRRMAAYALGWFAPSSAPVLQVALGDEDASVAATAALSLGLLGVAPPLTDDRAMVRGAAAIAQAKVHGRAASRAVVDELLRWAGREEQTDLPFLGGDLPGYAARSLRLVLPDDDERALDVLLGRLPMVSGVEALPVVGEALRRVFPASAPAPFDDLTERQKRVVRALAASPSSWLFRERAYGEFAWLLGSYGLPRDAESMRAYAGTVKMP
ncbi:HEAT repeat domain-containing protein [Actinoplanes sp. Pm04-4]|uniref:HEAT repeat domain-containing protein n=1 Tax=Paractinoplanes pyxinae TaxID=2997416 RepID=A0ABT4B3E0_9ACTN|nr:HEAT repeat domain-containing protein [Actinoplanes pyxinae]MCY1141014.1 HEAT repeat domain-containing protein [Actinoplanes pyxinae]